jgi:hypothetical protein
MSYYFPFRGTDAVTKQNIDYSISAVTASVPQSKTITAITASYAVKSEIVPPNGAPGLSITEFACQSAAETNPKLLKSGSTGAQGPTGSRGTDVLVCPDGTIRCTNLEVSLSAAFTYNAVSYPNGLNGSRPSGSQFSIICMQIPTTCSSAQAQAGCPDYLHIATPAIP